MPESYYMGHFRFGLHNLMAIFGMSIPYNFSTLTKPLKYLCTFQEANEALKHHSEESFSRLVVSMEEKFEESLKAEKEQMEVAFKLKAKDHDLYDRLASSPVTTGSNSRRASLVKISSMSDLLALKAPTLDSLEAMGSEELKAKFIVLMDHFYAAVDEIRALRARLSKAQDTIDAMEIDKLRLEIYILESGNFNPSL